LQLALTEAVSNSSNEESEVKELVDMLTETIDALEMEITEVAR